jgi:hypothetical protein
MTDRPQRSKWTVLAIAAAAVACVAAFVAALWAELGDAEMSAAGWAAMLLGMVVTLGLGFGLMALVFYSNRRGYDDEAGPRG